MDNIVGKKYGSLLVIEQLGHRKIAALCVCGEVKEFWVYNVTSGKTTSCGCLSASITSAKAYRKVASFLGKKFGKLTVIDILNTNKTGLRKVSAKCECGSVKEYFFGNLQTGKSSSCGCENSNKSSDRMTAINIKRSPLCAAQLGGLIITNLSLHPLYRTWCSMRARCRNKEAVSYKDYGGKGVRVCDEWENDFVSFYNWAINNGWSPGLQLDKDIKGNGLLYGPNACMFVTRSVNCRHKSNNRVITYDGVSKTLAEWSEITGISRIAIHSRIQRGWDLKKVFETPKHKKYDRQRTAP